LPYSKLAGIRIEIDAPGTSDPGQLICVWKKARELVDLLSQAGNLSHLVIRLLDNPQGKWMGRGRRPQKSIPGINDPRVSTFLEDWAVVVNQFCPLRRIPSVKIYIPERSDLGTAANPKI
jgi:hypothetical protein